MYLTEKYINPFTDYGFKRLFGEEAHKDLLLDFLNELLREEQGEIKNISFLKTEQLGSTEIDRKAIFDLYCENERGEKFIVELQKSKQNFFKDRALYYSTFPIREQAQKGEWNYELKAVYTIAILDFVFDEDKNEPDKYKYFVKLSDIDTNKIFYNKLTFVYLEMPKFKKELSEIDTHFEKWLYVLRHLEKLDQIPPKLTEKIFKRVFDVAEIAKFNREQLMQYEDSLKYYRDLKNSFDTSRADGRKEGREEGKQERNFEIAKVMLGEGFDIKIIIKVTGLTEEMILQ
ncbi:MAG: Rpn family recombination-promoting nuclease/putative transposase [Methylovulum sp.]|nr:Rpn family recombination-promoting nuclease/putative transposase [Methylovulum sp.]